MSDLIVTFGEIMLRLSPPTNLKCIQTKTFNVSYAGSEANVAISLASFGEECAYITGLADNDIGLSILQEIRKFNVNTKYIITFNSRQGLLFIEKGAMIRPGKVIYERENSAFSHITPGVIDWDGIFSQSKWFHWSGITPSLSQNCADVIKEALVSAKRNNIVVSVDLNFRSNLWKYGVTSQETMSALMHYCDVVIGNEEDAEKCLGIIPKSSDKDGNYPELAVDAYHKICFEIQKKYPNIQKISFSLRESINANHNRWKGLLYCDGRLFQSNTFDLTDIVDRVGAGDSFSAGIIYGLKNFNNDFQKTIDFSVASSALKHSIDGDFNLVSLVDVNRLVDGNSSGRISR